METQYYREMRENFEKMNQSGIFENKKIYLFGHCHATEELVDLFLRNGFSVAAILDNNEMKHGRDYRGIFIKPPQDILQEDARDVIVCIVARAYAAMALQLERLGYQGIVRKLVEYNSYADYSLSEDTISRMTRRRERGSALLAEMKRKHEGFFWFFCPFSALGDIYIMMSYLPYFMQKRGIEKCVVGVIGKACAQVVCLFGSYSVEIFSQKNMDEIIQAALYEQDEQTFIPHQDRPYVVNLFKALYGKRITLEQMYCCGVFGLPWTSVPYIPLGFTEYPALETIRRGNAVILSPYAKSVESLSDVIWTQVVAYYTDRGYQCFTNVVGEEKPLPGTDAISPGISEMKSVVEWAGTFIGIRSGICDVIRGAKARKVALYPDYNYSDTKWKAIDIYTLDGWENISVKRDGKWEKQ